jgi:hypothetical protein
MEKQNFDANVDSDVLFCFEGALIWSMKCRIFIGYIEDIRDYYCSQLKKITAETYNGLHIAVKIANIREKSTTHISYHRISSLRIGKITLQLIVETYKMIDD